MPFDSEATVEYAVPERLPPPACETHDIAVAAPQEAGHPQPNQLIRLLPIVTAVATVGAMAAAYYARSAVARNPVFMMFPVMMLMSAVATVLSGTDRRRSEINVRRAGLSRPPVEGACRGSQGRCSTAAFNRVASPRT